MIKASLPMILPVYHKLFNTILNLGTVPNICCSGIITWCKKRPRRITEEFVFQVVSILNQRLLGHAVSLNVLHKSQIGLISYQKIEHQIMFSPYGLLQTSAFMVIVKKYTIVLLISKRPLTQSGMVDSRINYCKSVYRSL